MRSTAHLSVLLAAALLAASCGDAAPPTSVDSDICGPGESQEDLLPEVLCVYAQSVVIETGFECPAEALNRFDHGPVTLCSSDPNLPAAQQDAIVQDFLDRHPGVQPTCDQGGVCGADERCEGKRCVPDEPPCVDADGDGFCADVDCDDANPEINPEASELSRDRLDNDCDGLIDEVETRCTLDADCPARNACIDGVCTI